MAYTGCWCPSMHISDPGGVRNSVRDGGHPGGQYSKSGYVFRKTSFSLETLTLRPNAREMAVLPIERNLPVQNLMLA